MKALVKYDMGPGNLEVRDLPEPAPEKNQVKIHVQYAGVCGSDLHIYHSDINIPVRPPVVIGHEFSGVIDEIGDEVEGWSKGDRAVSETAFSYCGECYNCIEGYYNLCDSRRTLGYWYNGVFASHTVVPAKRLHALPDTISFEEGALLEPLACVVHAFEDLADIKPWDVVLITGPGPIGLMALQIAAAAGARVIIGGKSIDARRLKIAESLGAKRALIVEEGRTVEAVKDLTGGRGADIAFECSGTEAGLKECLNNLRKRAQFVQIGVFGKILDQLDFERISFREVRATGSFGSRRANWNTAISLVKEGKVNLKPLIGAKMALDNWEEAFSLYEKKESMKILFDPNI